MKHISLLIWVTPHLRCNCPKCDEDQCLAIIANVSKNKLLIIYWLLLHPNRALLSQQTELWNKQNLCHRLAAVCEVVILSMTAGGGMDGLVWRTLSWLHLKSLSSNTWAILRDDRFELLFIGYLIWKPFSYVYTMERSI